MRVIAGELGGRRFPAPPGSGTRPTSDRVREALFSMLEASSPLDGLRVLDLFAGSGALGIEALSRGAERAVFVERDRKVATLLRQNLQALGIERARAEVRPIEALKAVRAASERAEAYDLVFLDPPYRREAGLEAGLSQGLGGLVATGARVVCEADRRSPLDLPWPVVTERRYGDTLIRIHQP
jgi:16S rRNA (guanine966-N2)-methyltransferase